MQAVKPKSTPALPSVTPADWDDNLPTIEWLKARRQALLRILFKENTTLAASTAAQAQLHVSRVRDLGRFDELIDAYEVTGHGEHRCGSCGMSELCDCEVSIA